MHLSTSFRSILRPPLAHALLIPVAGFVLATCVSAADPDPSTAESGAVNYANTCALCHGASGEGYVADNATALNNPTFLESVSDDFLRRSIASGRSATTMSAWSNARGGPHDDASISGIVAFMRTWQATPSADLSREPLVGNTTLGAPVYAANCAKCHGATGVEGPNVRLANPEFLSVASNAFLKYAIVHGRPGTSMPAYDTVLSADEIANVTILLRSWAKPVIAPDVPIPGTLGPIVQNPDGPEPEFVLGTRYTPADTIKAELDRGAAMGFLDARAPSDYPAGHIAGASNVPFYEATQFVNALPKDKWLICYCACPHAESGQLADTLMANGFTKVTVLDEGFYVWRDRGYPVTTGTYP